MLVNSDRRRSSDETLKRFNKTSPFGQLLDALRFEAGRLELWNDEMHRDLPKRWEKHGDLIILPHNCFKHRNWRLMGPKLWQTVTESLKVSRLGKKRIIEGDDFHRPHIDLLYGTDGWVEHLDKNIRFFYDVTKCMFNIEDIQEKQRISELDCYQEVVVDMFAGIGYYTLSYLINAHAKHVYALDWNEHAIEALQRNLECNGVQHRCTVIYGDSRRAAPQRVADRVNLGLVPSSRPYWLAACKCLKKTGGILHIHEAIQVLEQNADHLELNGRPFEYSRKSNIIRRESVKAVSEECGLGDNNTDTENNMQPGTDDRKESVWLIETMDESSVKNTNDRAVDAQKVVKRKTSRSATIVEEMEKRILPNGRIDDRFKENWPKMSETVRDFAMLCATNCTRYLNNIHDEVWTCTIMAVNKVKSYPNHVDHIVVDLLCQAEDEKTVNFTNLQTHPN